MAKGKSKPQASKEVLEENIIPLNVKFDKHSENPQIANIAKLLDEGFDLSLLSPEAGPVYINQKAQIATIALNRLVSDIARAKAKASEPARAGAQHAPEAPKEEKEKPAPRKRGISDLNNYMAANKS